MIRRIIFLILIFFSGCLSAQTFQSGISVGLAFSFGTAVNRMGVHTAVYGRRENAQLNAKMNLYYNFQSLGRKQKGWEYQLGFGGLIGFGRQDTIVNRFIGLTENNTYRDYALGASYIRYWDQMGTTQSTGIINANVHNFNLITENDLFGNFINQKDCYRTGAFLVEYQYNNTKFGLNALLWTEDYAHCPVIVDENSKKWARFGYYKDDAVKNRAISLGVASLKISQWMPYNQMASVDIGINSEKVRNAVQNEFIHDQPFFPNSWVRRKPAHIPMFTVSGEQYLHDPDQQVKPGNFYFNLGLNPMPFY